MSSGTVRAAIRQFPERTDGGDTCPAGAMWPRLLGVEEGSRSVETDRGGKSELSSSEKGRDRNQKRRTQLDSTLSFFFSRGTL